MVATIKRHAFRAVAEFERQESVLLTWPPEPEYAKGENIEELMIRLIDVLNKRVDVHVQCYYSDPRTVEETLKNAGIDLTRVSFVRYEPDDMIIDEDDDTYVETSYPRDYGADVLMDGEGRRAVVDFDYSYYSSAGTLPSSRDARIMKAFSSWHASLAGIDELVFTRLVSEGGDREFNGKGVMMCIEETEVSKRNPGMTRDEVEREFKRIYNLKQVIWLPKSTFEDEDHFAGPIPGPDGIWNAFRSSSANGHIDEMCRFCSEDTILLAHVREEEAAESELDRLNKERLDMAYEVLKMSRTADGHPFRIIRIPLPKPIYYTIEEDDYLYEIWQETKGELGEKLLDGSPYPTGKMVVLPAMSYCNFLITNGCVIGQKYYREGMDPEIKERDELARDALQVAFPDHEIIQLDSMPLNLGGGGIHCGTRQIPAAVPSSFT